jgi:serine/threonine-protein kinase
VILYQLLTLRPAFHRSSLKTYRKEMEKETYIEPIERAPYRDIPQHLNEIVKRCLCYAPEERFGSVDEMICELKNFLEGKPEWSLHSVLDPAEKNNWAFQEHILLTKHAAITRSPEVMQWVGFMLSHAHFAGNLRISTRFKLEKQSQGIGILLGNSSLTTHLDEGFCLWMGVGCHLFHNHTEILSISHDDLRDSLWHELCIDVVDSHIFASIDNKKICHYISRIPFEASRIGLMCKDTHYLIDPLQVSVGSHNAQVSCLAVPDAFLKEKNYEKARVEYRKIAHSFKGRFEGREALFKIGMTLIEQAKHSQEKEPLLLMALEEFSQLRHTPSAPLEYLGKALVYKATAEVEEEIKCFELALRKYPKHPSLKVVIEEILFRLYETSSKQRKAAYLFALLALRHLPHLLLMKEHAGLFSSLKKHLEKSPLFLLAEPEEEHLACQIAFWLNKPISLVELIETSASAEVIANALYALMMLGKEEWAEENLHYLKEPKYISCALLYFKKGARAAFDALIKETKSCTNAAMRAAYFLFDKALLDNKIEGLLPYFNSFEHTPFIDALHLCFCLTRCSTFFASIGSFWCGECKAPEGEPEADDPKRVGDGGQRSRHPPEWAERGKKSGTSSLKEKNLQAAQALIATYPPEILHDEYSPLFVPMGCYLVCTEKKEIPLSHFEAAIELPFPPTSMLLSYYLRERLPSEPLFWEQVTLLRQVALYYSCLNEEKKVKEILEELHNLFEVRDV